jgi:hypothetical protein
MESWAGALAPSALSGGDAIATEASMDRSDLRLECHALYVAVASTLVAGVISSLLAVAILEAYHFGRRRYSRRAIKSWLPMVDGRCTIFVPAFTGTESLRPGGLLSSEDAYAVAHILDAGGKVGLQADILSSASVAQGAVPGLICVGGPAGNRFTASTLTEHCPGFQICGTRTERGIIETLQCTCGGHKFIANAVDTYAFITYLPSKVTGQIGGTLILWGFHGLATLGAAYYLVTHSKSIYRKYRGKEFFFAIRLDRRLGYRVVPEVTVDLTRHALKPADSS